MPPAATSVRGLRPAPGEYVYPVADTTTPMNPKEEPTQDGTDYSRLRMVHACINLN